jgi:hypothetical protein
LRDFAILQAVSDEPNEFLLTSRQNRHPFGILNSKRPDMGQRIYATLEIFSTCPVTLWQRSGSQIFKEKQLTIGLDLGDHFAYYCVLEEVGEVVVEQ